MAPKMKIPRSSLFASALLWLVFWCIAPHFGSLSNLDNILTASAVTGTLALGATFVIASGGIDLSIASVMALTATTCATVVQGSAFGGLEALLLCLAIGAGSGACTGALVYYTGAPSFVVSLGIMSVARALAYIVSDGVPVYGLPDGVVALGQGRLGLFSAPVYLLLGATLLSYVLLHHTRFGLHLLWYGDNPVAAKALGIRIGRLQCLTFATCGLLAGMAGFIFMARTNSGDPTAGISYELVAITAVVLGGTDLFGGRASIAGTFLGALCLGILQNGLTLLAVSTYYQILFVGLVLLAAALLVQSRDRT